MTYTYNPDNSLASIRYPSGRQVSQTYDAIGRMLSIADATTTYLSGLAYNGAGQATAFQYGNGVQAAFTYNDHLELATLRYFKTGAADLLSLKYDYTSGTQAGNNGQIQAIHYCTTEPVTCSSEDATKTENFTYDPWSRLATAQTTDITSPGTFGVTEHYDRFGNRQEQDVSGNWGFGTTFVVDPNTNRISDTGYAYDAAGNMTNDTNHTYTYDAMNWLTQVKTGGTVVASYTYLGALRVKKVAESTTTVYVYSGTKPIAEYVGGTLSNEYIYAGSGMLATVAAGGAVTYQHPDHLSIRAESDSNGNLIRSTGNFPFGEKWYDTSPGSKWQFTTYERDSESALDYADYRFYSSRLGRFMQADPMGGNPANPGSLDRYSYVQNDPVNAVDPLGLFTCLFEDWWFGYPGGKQELIGQYPIFCWDENEGGGFGGGGGGGGGRFRSAIENARSKALAILKNKNGDCAKYFGQNAASILENMQIDPKDGPFMVTTRTQDEVTLYHQPDVAWTVEGTADSPTNLVQLNSHGAFFNYNAPIEGGGANRFNLTVQGSNEGGFPGDSPQAQITVLLHELGHAIGLLPRDGGDPTGKQSMDNTDTVLEHCKQEILAAAKGK